MSAPTTAGTSGTSGSIRSLIPARIDRLPWSKFHTRMVIALGAAWILDGLEITIASVVGDALTQKNTLNMSVAAVGAVATVYLIGQVLGALVFGRLSDKLGRKNLFMVTLGIYLVGSGLSAATSGASTGWIVFFYATRLIAGMGIGGEYTAINSAIDELIPAKYRGRVDVAVNGTYWAGAIIGTLVEVFLYAKLEASNPSLAWRLGFLLGPVLGLVILLVRRNLPESPRWQIMHGREAEAEASISYIEQEVIRSGRELAPVDESKLLEIKPAPRTGTFTMLKVLFVQYPARAVLAFGLMITQSFLYNAIYFTYSAVLGVFFHVSAGDIGWYGLAFAVGNLIGPLVLGTLFDTVGRRKMIAGTYLISGALLLISAILFNAGALTATTQTACWVVIFFFASAGASAGYLTMSEIFPLEVRAQAISVVFSVAQIVGAVAPLIFGLLIDKNHPVVSHLFIGYLVGSVIMMAGGLIAAFLGVNAEGKSLEDVATPLSVVRKAAEKVSDIASSIKPGGDEPPPVPAGGE